MVSDGLRINILHLGLSYGVTLSKGLIVDLFDKVGYHGLTFFKQNHIMGYRELPSHGLRWGLR